jgi:hypothetical protein
MLSERDGGSCGGIGRAVWAFGTRLMFFSNTCSSPVGLGGKVQVQTSEKSTAQDVPHPGRLQWPPHAEPSLRRSRGISAFRSPARFDPLQDDGCSKQRMRRFDCPSGAIPLVPMLALPHRIPRTCPSNHPKLLATVMQATSTGGRLPGSNGARRELAQDASVPASSKIVGCFGSCTRSIRLRVAPPETEPARCLATDTGRSPRPRQRRQKRPSSPASRRRRRGGRRATT